MKKVKLSFLLGFLLLSLGCLSQIHIDSAGKITLNSNSWPGGLKVGPINYGGFTISALYPAEPNFGGLGSADNFLHAGYIHHLYSAVYDTWPSDRRAKENIKGIDNALGTIKLLNPVKYNIKASFYEKLSEEAKREFRKTSMNRLGFIAQEVQEILPELVHTEPITGMMGISTMDIVPILVKAIKEQQYQIEVLQKRIENLEIIKK
jgi:hypothetical protein